MVLLLILMFQGIAHGDKNDFPVLKWGFCWNFG